MTRAQLFLFMTEGMSLASWRESGMLDRELALYKRLAPQLVGVVIVSYGGREELGICRDLPGIEVICNRWGLPHGLYRRLLPLLVRRALRRPAVFKSNQVRGAELAQALARRCGATFVARCGYLLSDFQGHAHGQGSPEQRAARQLEGRLFRGADHGIVTTAAMRDRLVGYGVEAGQLSVIPNYVDTRLFAPAEDAAPAGRRLVFIGRLEAQKNPLALVRALRGLGVTLDVVGEGSLRAALAGEAERCGVALRLHGRLPHHALPAIIRAGSLYVLPSLYEGHPKTLLEAMACGAAVIGTRVPGIAEVICHGQTGWLCEPTEAGLRQAVTGLLADDALRAALGRAARACVVAGYELDRVVAQELALYRRLLAGRAESVEGESCRG